MALTSTFRWLHIADIHFGANHIDSYKLQSALEQIVYPRIDSSLDLLTIGGDWYDSALYLDNVGAIIGSSVLMDIFFKARANHVAVRMIRGTYTHDRDQLVGAVRAASRLKDFDFKYYDQPAVDKVRDALTFIYLPDNLGMTTFQVYDWIQEAAPDGADCALIHGYFEHALPCATGVGKHLEAFNADILHKYIRRLIAAGHVHTSSIYKDFVYYSGSFDRLRHGEEEEKGCYLFTLEPDRKHEYEFIPNPFATPHITVRLTKDDITEALIEVEDAIDKLFPKPIWGYLRIAGMEERLQVASIIRNKYKPNLTVTDYDITRKDRSGTLSKLDSVFTTYTGKILTPDNISSQLYQYLVDSVDDFPLSETDVEQALQDLQQEI